MTDVKRRVDGKSAKASLSHPQEYDGANAPVLIRLPDLEHADTASSSAALQSSAGQVSATAGAEDEAHEEKAATKSRRSKRRIDRSHLPQRPKMPVRETVPFNFRSKYFIATMLVVVIGLAYIFGGRSDREDPKVDAWASTSETEPSTESNSGPTDLWPADSGLPERRVSSSSQTNGPPSPVTDEMSSRQDSPTLSGPNQPWANPQTPTWQVSGSSTSESQWPESQSVDQEVPPGGPMKQVSWPDEEEGASNTSVDTSDLASLVGLQFESSVAAQQMVFNDTPPIPPQRRNHERLRSSLR